MGYEQLKLDNQLCFPVYAASRLIIREYQPLLDKLEITYPQYLVLLILWEKDAIYVNEISEKLILNTNTLTPLLKRMEAQKIITRERSSNDERKVVIKLTKKGRKLEDLAVEIPQKLLEKVDTREIELNKLIELRDILNVLINTLNKS